MEQRRTRGCNAMKSLPSQYDRAAVEAEYRQRWAGEDAFRWDASLPADLDYVIDTPPPTVSGTLHVGHVYSYTQADIIARYFRMSGRNVLYPIGWDDNGLPTERLVEKIKKVRGGAMSRDEFVALCRELIPEYEDRFRDLFSRLALSVDWSREYQTISDESRKVSQLSFLDLYRKGLLERRLEPTLWDPADRTALAQAEVEEIERVGKLNTVAFALEDGGEVLIATTRPELIGGCGALMIHPDNARAKELVGKRVITPLYGVPVPIIADEKVDPEKGTGMVMCCTFGDVTDIHWWRTHKLPLRIVIDQTGRMVPDLPIGTTEWPSIDAQTARATIDALKGLKIEQARATVLEKLKETGALREQVATNQVVPVAERSGTPLEIIVTPQWFIKTLDYKEQILAKGAEITWHPPYMRQRFDSWVEALKWDWSISRQRHFGVPLPVWYSRRKGEEGKIILPSPEQLPVDPTRDLPAGYTADEVTGEKDVMDTWATSSVSPQLVTRTINEDLGMDQAAHKRLFPMAMRPQAHDIIRTWAFYTIVKAMHHQNTVPWHTICVSGWCLAVDGSKMSKSKGNIIDPLKMLDEYGTDAVRYWTGTSRLGNDTVLSPNTLKQGKRLVTKLWNAVRLAHMALGQATIAPKTPAADLADGIICHPLDKWLLGALADTVNKASEDFEAYEYAQALREIEQFFWATYCDNYLELVKSRTRFEGEPSVAQRSALHTLYHASLTLVRLFAPYLPFVCETLNESLMGNDGVVTATVHARGNWPKQGDQASPNLETKTGAMVLEFVEAMRKAKSDLAVSLRANVETLVIAPADGGPVLADIKSVLGPLVADLKDVATAAAIVFEEAPRAGWPGNVSPGGTLHVSLKLAPAET